MTSLADNSARRERLFLTRASRSNGLGYSRLVRSLRLLLPLLACALLALAVIWPQLDWRQIVVADDSDVKIDINDAQELRMRNARLVGTDENNQPFNVSAKEARQGDDGVNSVILDHPSGELALQGGGQLTMQANSGHYDREAKRLELSGAVTVHHGDGYQFQSESATVSLDTGRAVGSQPIEGFGPQGLLKGEGFEILDKGKTVRILGKSRLIVTPPPEQK
jgi:lipopolysaccharide export system protein LptC